jgi:hypothetical protein
MLSQDDLQRLKETNACPEGNLSEAVLVGANLEGAHLTGANLFIAVLKEANLQQGFAERCQAGAGDVAEGKSTRGSSLICQPFVCQHAGNFTARGGSDREPISKGPIWRELI